MRRIRTLIVGLLLVPILSFGLAVAGPSAPALAAGHDGCRGYSPSAPYYSGGYVHASYRIQCDRAQTQIKMQIDLDRLGSDPAIARSQVYSCYGTSSCTIRIKIPNRSGTQPYVVSSWKSYAVRSGLVAGCGLGVGAYDAVFGTVDAFMSCPTRTANL